ncbi:MAG: hypothetical protein ABIP03_04255 [Aquihabitans sp.]
MVLRGVARGTRFLRMPVWGSAGREVRTRGARHSSGAGIEGGFQVQSVSVARDGSLPLEVQASRCGTVRTKRRWLGTVRNIQAGGRQFSHQE